MAPARYCIYCDKSDDEELARIVFATGPLSGAQIVRLPDRARAPQGLQEFLEWERADWLITRDDVLVAAAELTRHGYTGDNGFQRFARLKRAAMLGVPSVYFTPFSRTRLNELDQGRVSPRNVAPELFAALLHTGREFDTPALALRWPTDSNGESWPLGELEAQQAVSDLRTLMERFATVARRTPREAWNSVPPRLLSEMERQASIPARGGSTSFAISLPTDLAAPRWIESIMPVGYFGQGKADKILAAMAMRRNEPRSLQDSGGVDLFWDKPGIAHVQYIGYQWRPDPACGLIARAGEIGHRFGQKVIVVWPRLFLRDSRRRQDLLRALDEFTSGGIGEVAQEGARRGFSSGSLERLRARLNTDSKQFGLFAESSKVGRILPGNADLCVFADGLYVPR